VKRYLTFWNAVGLFLLVTGLALFLYLSRTPGTQVINFHPGQTEESQPREVQLRLYFAKPDATGFVIEKRRVTLGSGEDVYQRAITELIAGPRQGGEPIVPPGEPVPTVFVSGRSAYVDLPKSYLHIGYGTTGETLLIYGIANTILDQGPVDEVWFLIGGEPAKTLGHLSLIEPIRRTK